MGYCSRCGKKEHALSICGWCGSESAHDPCYDCLRWEIKKIAGIRYFAAYKNKRIRGVEMYMPMNKLRAYRGVKAVQLRENTVFIWSGGRLLKEVKYKNRSSAKKMFKYYSDRLM